jgi:hypothetical protein
MYRSLTLEFDQKVSTEAPRELAELQQAQTARLTDPPRWEIRPDSGDGGRSLVIPIEQAMEALAAGETDSSSEGRP